MPPRPHQPAPPSGADGTAVPGTADVPQPELDPNDSGGITLSSFTYTVSFADFNGPYITGNDP
jgi:hypothetical protein